MEFVKRLISEFYKKTVLIRNYYLLDKGFLETCDAVAETLGAEGKIAILDNNDKAPILTKDGVSVAERIRYKNPTKNFGALQAITGASYTLAESGDSTTTTMVFAQGFLRNFKRRKFNKGVERGVYKAVNEVYGHIKDISTKAKKTDLERIAITSCNNDKSMAETVMKAFNYVGKDGYVNVSENPKSHEITIVEQDGMVLPFGFASPLFSNVTKPTIAFNYDNCYVFCAKIVSHNEEFMFYLNQFFSEKGKDVPVVIFTERQVNTLINICETNKLQGKKINVVSVTTPDILATNQTLDDIALLTGGVCFDPNIELKEKVFKVGKAKKVVSTIDKTIISVDEVPVVTDINEEERKRRWKMKSAIIEVGGLTPTDRKEKFDRVEDAVASVKSTLEEGFIAGGGSSLSFIAQKLNTKLLSNEEQAGYNLVKKVLDEPFKRILKNSNRTNRLKKYFPIVRNQYGVGYNAIKDDVSNLIDDGVIDSSKSIRIALKSATETAVKMFNVGVIVHFPSNVQ